MKVDQLKAALREAGLPTAGRKAELQARLRAAAQAASPPASSGQPGQDAAEPGLQSPPRLLAAAAAAGAAVDSPSTSGAGSTAPREGASTPVRSVLSGLLSGALSPLPGQSSEGSPDSTTKPAASPVSASKPFAFAKMVIELQKASSMPKTFEQAAKEAQDRYFRKQQEEAKDRKRSPRRGP
eukprot:SAG22_NODE_3392_length_1735_cov_1.455990_2_plen_182_part_00